MYPGTGLIVPSGSLVRPSNFVANAGGTSYSTGYERAAPLVIARQTAFTAIGAQVTTPGSAGSVVRLGVRYAGDDGAPDALLVDAGTIDGTSATYQTIAVSLTLAIGLYWLVLVTQVASCSLYGYSAGANLPTDSTGSLSDQVGGYRNAGGESGALPASFGTPVRQNPAPLIGLVSA